MLPEPVSPMLTPVLVGPKSAERVCPEVTGKLCVAFVKGIGSLTLSKKNAIDAFVVALLVSIKL